MKVTKNELCGSSATTYVNSSEVYTSERKGKESRSKEAESPRKIEICGSF
jgi:hypothetical protein